MKKSIPYIIETKHLRLDAVTEADCQPYYADWLNDSKINRYMETRWSAQNLDSIFRFVKSMESDPANYLFAIRLRTSSRHIGNLKIGPINFNHSYADLSYFIGDRDFWGKGIATEAIQGAIEFAFENLSLRRLNAGVYSSNIGSVKALQKCGFVTEGVAVDKFRIDDHFEDHIMLGLYR